MGCFSSSESEQSSSSTQKNAKQEEYLGKALDLYGNELGKNENVWSGDRVAGFSDTQQNVLNNIPSFMAAFGTPQTTSTPLFNETGNAIGGLLSGQAGASKITDNQVESYFTDKIKDPTMRMLKDDLLPTVDEGYAGGNFFGSARGKARDSVITDVTNNLSGQRADLNWNVTQANQAIDESKANRSLSAVPQAMQYGQMPAQETMNNLKIAATQVAGMSDLFGFGQKEQTQEQMELQARIAKFAEDNQITDANNMAIILSLLNMNYGSAQSSGSSSGPGLGYSIASGSGQGAGAALTSAAIASDRAVKENIKPISVLDKVRTLKAHRYNYKDSTQPRIGLIAQDVEAVFPEAVLEIDGIKHVDIYAIQSIIIGAIAEMGKDS